MHILVKTSLVSLFVTALMPGVAIAQQSAQGVFGYLNGAPTPENDSAYWSYEFTNLTAEPGANPGNVQSQFANQEVSYQSADLDGDGNVSRLELIGMLEGGKMRDGEVLVLRDDNSESTSLEVGATEGDSFFGLSPRFALAPVREERFAQTDTNGDGGVNVDELMELRRVLMAERGNDERPNAEQRARRATTRIMGRIDTDNDGRITRTELALARSARVERMVDRVDSNNDGQISPEEWQTASQ